MTRRATAEVPENELEKKVIRLVKDHWSGANVRDVEIDTHIPQFLRGGLYIVSIWDANDYEHHNYVYVEGRQLQHFKTANDLVTGVARIGSGQDIWSRIFSVTVLLGLAFVVMIIALVGLLISGNLTDKATDAFKTFLLPILTGFLASLAGPSQRRDQ